MKIFTLIKEFKNGKCTKTEVTEEKIMGFYSENYFGFSIRTEKTQHYLYHLNQWYDGCCCANDLQTFICFFSMITPNSCSKEKFLKKLKKNSFYDLTNKKFMIY